jgi:hypothetical protein
MEPDLSGGPRRSTIFEFWQGYARADEDTCKNALGVLEDILGDGAVPSYGVGVTSLSDSSSGKFVQVEMPLTSPKSAQDAWNSDKKTSLMRVDPWVHCLSIDGDAKKHDGGNFFVACASPGAMSRATAACTVGTHTMADRPKVVLIAPAYLVKVKPSSMATKQKVLADVFLYEHRSIPEILIDIGCSDLLEELPATPRVWKAVLENYPGLETMTRLSADPQQEEEREASIASSHYLRVSDVMPPSDSTPKAVPQAVGSRVDTQRTDHEALDEAMVNAFTRFYPQGAPPDLFNMGGGDQSVASSASGVSRQTDPLHRWQNAFGNAGGQTGQDFSAPIWRLERSLAGLLTSVTHRIMGQMLPWIWLLVDSTRI